MGVGDVRGVRNFSRFPTPGHPFYLAHYEVDHEAGPGEVGWGVETLGRRRRRGGGGRLFLFFSIYRYPISGSGNVYQRAGVQPPSRRKRERDRDGGAWKKRGRERERRGISFSPSPILLDELARYRVARRSNAAPGRAEGAEGTRRRKKGRERGLGCLDRSPEMDTENRHYKLTSLIDGQRARDDAGGREETRGEG